jgi:hypothetical protein
MPTTSQPDSNQLESEVLALREQLARLEQEHADLRVELHEFELLYNARVGPFEAQLAEAQLHIDEYQLRLELVQWRGKSLSPLQLEAEVEHRLRAERERAEAIQANADLARSAVPPPPIDAERAANLDLKQIYRELAKRAHPDLAADEADRAARSQRMADVNALYARQDLEGLRRILRQLETRRLTQDETPEQRLAHLKDERLRLDAAIRHVKAEVADLNRDPLMVLKLEAALGRSRGHDVLAETVQQMQARLFNAEYELQELIARFREVVEAAGLAE